MPLLVNSSLARAGADREQPLPALTPEASEMLRKHPWPGNLSELFAVLDTARQRATGSITANDLPASLRLKQRLEATAGRDPERAPPLDVILEQVKRRLIVLALERTQGNRSKAAESLGLLRLPLAAPHDGPGALRSCRRWFRGGLI